jgi:hypothetical protein
MTPKEKKTLLLVSAATAATIAIIANRIAEDERRHDAIRLCQAHSAMEGTPRPFEYCANMVDHLLDTLNPRSGDGTPEERKE